LAAGEEIVFYPSGKKTTVKSIETYNSPKKERIGAGYAAGFTVTEQIYIRRGELCASAKDQTKPYVSSAFRASLFWLGKEPMERGKTYFLKIGSAKVEVKIKEIIKVIDASIFAGNPRRRCRHPL